MGAASAAAAVSVVLVAGGVVVDGVGRAVARIGVGGGGVGAAGEDSPRPGEEVQVAVVLLRAEEDERVLLALHANLVQRERDGEMANLHFLITSLFLCVSLSRCT